MIKAVVYTSLSGFTRQYAELLANELSLPLYALEQAEKELPQGAEILFLGWVQAGQITGYKKAAKRFSVQAVAAVGMSYPVDTLAAVIAAQSKIEGIPVFYLQGGYAPEKLSGPRKLMMKAMAANLRSVLGKKEQLDVADSDMLDLAQNGGSRVDVAALAPLLEWYSSAKLQ